MPITNVCGLRNRRFTTIGGSGSSVDWADSYVTNQSGVASLLATDSHRVGIRATNLANIGQNVTSGNGASLSIVSAGSWDGVENAVRLNPPTATVLGEGQYACILQNVDLWGNGSKDIAQCNFRWTQFYASNYFSHSGKTKVSGFKIGSALTPGGSSPARAGYWEGQDTSGWTPWKYVCVTSNTVQVYHNPMIGVPPLDSFAQGEGVDTAADTTKMFQMRSAASHGASPPQVGNEWVCFEAIADTRQDRGNANGMVKLLCWTRDGVVSARYLQCPINRDQGAVPWNFANRYIALLEYLGGYWNAAVGTADANNYTMFSHMTLAANMGISEVIGPPPGFVS